jgi:uncharacterized protein YutE (UPF0331/DUF86 family)
MKQIIITDNYTIEKITDEISWIKSEARSLKKFLEYQSLNQNINRNASIYIQHILDSCNTIDSLIKIEKPI